MLDTVRFGDFVQIGVNLIQLLLHCHINRGIDMQTALRHKALKVLLRIIVRSFPVNTAPFAEILSHLFQNQVHIPGIHFAGSIAVQNRRGITLGTVGFSVGHCYKRATLAVIAAFLIDAVAIAVFLINSPLKGQICAVFQSLGIFFLRQPAILLHHIDGIFTTAFISFGTCQLLIFVIIQALTVGIKQRRIIGDTDQCSTFGYIQIFQLLAEISGSCSFYTLAAFTQIDLVQIPLHNELFVVTLFKFRSTEDFQHLTLHGYIVSRRVIFQVQILDQLLGNGRTAKFSAANKHTDAGLDGRNPVHTLMFKETVILNGNRRIDQRFRDLVISCPFFICLRVEFLKHLQFALFIRIIEYGIAALVKVTHNHFGIADNLVTVQIISKQANKGKGANADNDCNRRQRTHHNLKKRVQTFPEPAQKLNGFGRLPGLS